ncbi:MAG TPA: PEP-CTERM sorting domain-containing protein [Phycisphaerae bacterium]|nr:PEP-CTERM sorting domain-containing protein [Phycisphaerae bacterium]
MVTFPASYEFSGACPPEGPTPWLTATFDDEGTPGSVDLLLDTTNLIDNEFVFEWLFNLDPDLNLSALVFSAPIKTGTFTDPTINTGVDTYMANGDGFFDIQIDFDSTDGSAKRFGVGDAVQYTITGIPTLTANSFNFLSAMDGGSGEFPTAAHVGGIGSTDDQSGWVSVPEPAALPILAVGALALLRRKRE